MRAKLLVAVGLIVVVALQWSDRAVAQGQDVLALYARSASLGDRTQGKVFNVAETPTWIQGSAEFWYRKSVKGGNQFVLVDPAAKTKAAPFDHARLATSLSAAAAATYTAVTLPFNTFEFVSNRQAIEFAIGAGGGGRQGGGGGAGRGGAPAGPPQPRWRCTLADYACARVTASPDAAQAGRAGGQGRAGGGGAGRAGGAPGAAAPEVRTSPDGKFEAVIQNFNVYVRPAGGNATSGFMLSTDGSEGNAYRFQNLAWSPDSKKLVTFRRRPGYERLVHYVDSSPRDQVQPKHTTIFYRKPGDVVDFDHPGHLRRRVEAADDGRHGAVSRTRTR